MAVTAGLRVGRYEVLRKLGQGGFGILYVGRDTELDREVALKFLRPEHVTRPDVVMRFLQEARSAAKINHSGIVTVFECGQVAGTGTRADGTVYIAMELLAGESLQARLKRERILPPAVAIGIVRQMCVALQAAHDAGIVHRDLKPDNIFCVPDAGMRDGVRVKILDFGVAKLADGQFGGGVRTHSAMMLGTPNYMSPEQCKSSAKVDHRSDIYAVGCILYELVCGRRPYEGDAGEQIAQHQLGPVPVPRDVNAAVPEELDRIIRQMLAKSPDERPGSMLFVDEALAAIDRGALPATAPVAPQTFEAEQAPTQVSERRSPRLPLALGALGVIAVGIIAGVALTRGGSDAKPADASPEPIQAVVAERSAPSPDAALPSEPRVTASDLQVDCLKLAADRKWKDLIECSDRLARLGSPDAANLRAKGVMEDAAAATAVLLDDAIGARDAGRAASELSKIPKDSVYRHDAELAYATLPPSPKPKVKTEKQTPDPFATAPCDADALKQKGEDHLMTGMDASALASFEASMKCRPDASLMRLAFMAACRSRNAPKAKLYFARLPQNTSTGIAQICKRNGIELP